MASLSMAHRAGGHCAKYSEAKSGLETMFVDEGFYLDLWMTWQEKQAIQIFERTKKRTCELFHVNELKEQSNGSWR